MKHVIQIEIKNKQKILAGVFMFGNKPLVVPKSDEVHNNEKNGNCGLNDFAIHKYLFTAFANNRRKNNNKRKHSGGDIECKQSHAIIKKLDAHITPTANVSHENFAALKAGTNTPTTSEPKTILAPSRKKFEIIRGCIFDFMLEPMRASIQAS